MFIFDIEVIDSNSRRPYIGRANTQYSVDINGVDESVDANDDIYTFCRSIFIHHLNHTYTHVLTSATYKYFNLTCKFRELLRLLLHTRVTLLIRSYAIDVRTFHEKKPRNIFKCLINFTTISCVSDDKAN